MLHDGKKLKKYFRTFQGEKFSDTGGGRVFSLDASSGLLATAGAFGAGAILELSG